MAIRNFTLIGTTNIPESTGTITINGVEVFNGTFIDHSDDEAPIATGSIEIDDSADIWVPVVVTVDSGSVGVGMFKWNYGYVNNPALTPEEAVYATTLPTRLVPTEILESVTEKGGFYVKSADQYTYGSDTETTNVNRNNMFISGDPIAVPYWYYININNTVTLTFDTLIFSRT